MARAYRVYTGADGLTHSEILKAFPEPAKNIQEMTARRGVLDGLKPLSVRFTTQAPGFFTDWHPQGRPVLIVTLSGGAEYSLSDGTVLRGGPGDVFLFEDDKSIGKGHSSLVPGNEPRLQLIISL